jgi:hypothetical protein
MKYLKNNGKPRPIIIANQKKLGYFDKEGNQKNVRVVMWRHPTNEAADNSEAQELMCPKAKKMIVYSTNGRQDGEERKVDLGYSEKVMSYPHIMKVPVGTSKRDERIYTIMTGETTEFKNEDDAEHILKIWHFVDEVDKEGELVDREHILTGQLVKGNPYRPLPSERADRRLAPTKYDEVDTELAPRQNPIDMRVREITRISEEDEKLLE